MYSRDTKPCDQCNSTHCSFISCRPAPTRPDGEPRNVPERVNRISEGPSYSRTCPVVLYHPQARRPIIGLAVLDDQSSITLMSPHAIQKMGLPSDSLRQSSLATVTVQGTSAHQPCRMVDGLTVAPVGDPRKKIQLPDTFVQYEIPCAAREVPYMYAPPIMGWAHTPFGISLPA